MNTIPWQTIIRAILKFGGGWFMSKGILMDDSTVEAVSAGLAASIGIVWGWVEKRRLARKLAELQAKSDSEVSI